MKYIFTILLIILSSTYQTVALQKKNQNIVVNIHLQLRNLDKLNVLVQKQQDITSNYYRQWISDFDFKTHFAPPLSSIRYVEDWAQKAGLTIINRFNHDTIIKCSTTSEQFEKVLGLKPSEQMQQLPPELISYVSNIERSDNKTFSNQRSNLVQDLDLQSPIRCISDKLTPTDLLKIYNLSALHNTGTTGTGQKIAILVPGKFLETDLAEFQRIYNLPTAKIETHFIGNIPPTSVFQETIAEIEYLTVFAPGAIIQVIELPTDSNGNVSSMDLTTGISYVVDKLKDTKVIVSSLGSCERTISKATINAQEALFLQSAAQGQTWVIATGNTGAQACLGNEQTVNYPASSPLVTAVGGTEVLPKRNEAGVIIDYETEIAWNNELGASGGGTSSIFDQPQYQSKLGILPNGKRNTPDVAFHSAGNLAVISNGAPNCYFGTGVSAVAWGALFALVNQSIGGDGLGAVNIPLYSLGSAQATGQGQSIFHDITNGNNFLGDNDGNVAGPGYDQVTGWGSFDAVKFVRNFTAGIPRPNVQLSTSVLDFGTLRINTKSNPLNVTLTSTGVASLQINGLKLDKDAQESGFSLENCGKSNDCNQQFTLENTENISVQLSWTPKKEGLVKGKFFINTNIPGRSQLSIALVGKGSDDAIPPKVALLKFVGGEIVEPGSKVEIKWVATDNNAVVKQIIDLSINGGTNFDIPIIAGLSGKTTTFEWEVPKNLVSKQAKLRVRAFDEAQNVGEDISNGVFTIPDKQPPSVTFESTVPRTFEVSDLINLSWKMSDNGKVDSQELFLVSGNTKTSMTVFDNLITSFSWNTSKIIAANNLKLLLVTKDSGGNITSIESTPFTALPKIVETSLGKNSLEINGFGFDKDSTKVRINGILVSNSAVISSNQILIREISKKLRIKPGSQILVTVNDVDSKVYFVHAK